MPLTRTRLLEVGLGTLLLLLAASSFVRSRVTAARADAEHSVNETLRKQMAQLSADYDKKIADREVQFQHDKQSLQAEFDAASKDNHRMAALISSLMHLPKPVEITQASAPAGGTLTGPPQAVATVPEVDFAKITEYTRNCEATKLDNQNCKDNLRDREAQMKLAQAQITNLQKENKDLRSAAHGTFFVNLKRGAKWLGIGAGSAVVALCGTGHCSK